MGRLLKGWSAGAWAVVMIGAVSAAGCDDRVAGDDANDGYEVVIDGDLELIGISGRRLQDGESYRVPLDSVQVVHLGDTAREAMVLVNRSRHDILIGSLSLNAPNEWRLLAPTRARGCARRHWGVVASRCAHRLRRRGDPVRARCASDLARARLAERGKGVSHTQDSARGGGRRNAERDGTGPAAVRRIRRSPGCTHLCRPLHTTVHDRRPHVRDRPSKP